MKTIITLILLLASTSYAQVYYQEGTYSQNPGQRTHIELKDPNDPISHPGTELNPYQVLNEANMPIERIWAKDPSIWGPQGSKDNPWIRERVE